MHAKHFGPDYVDAWSWEPFCVGWIASTIPSGSSSYVLLPGESAASTSPGQRARLAALADDFGHLAAAGPITWSSLPRCGSASRSFRRRHFTGGRSGPVRASDRRTRVEAIEATAARLVERHPRVRIFLASDNAG